MLVGLEHVLLCSKVKEATKPSQYTLIIHTGIRESTCDSGMELIYTLCLFFLSSFTYKVVLKIIMQIDIIVAAVSLDAR